MAGASNLGDLPNLNTMSETEQIALLSISDELSVQGLADVELTDVVLPSTQRLDDVAAAIGSSPSNLDKMSEDPNVSFFLSFF